jgi:predicted metalloprotease
MKWEGRQGSGNVEDSRGMSAGRIAVGCGLGTLIIVITFYCLEEIPLR